MWRGLSRSRVMEVLHNPSYAGAYCYGRRKQRRIDLEGHTHVAYVPREEWHTLLIGAHEGYITWEEFEQNQKALLGNARGLGHEQYAPREGPALLQGLVVCGVCGKRMTVRYHRRRGCISPDYVCQGERNTWALPTCQSISGGGIDEAIGSLLLELVTPLTLEVALAVQQEMQARIEEADRLRHQQVERAGYEAELARRRYMQVDPDNRLVASSLESEWNDKLRELTRSREEYEQARAADRLSVDDRARSQVLALAHDFPKLWQDPRTPDRERKRMVRLMIEDVTLIKSDSIAAHIRFKAGATKSLQVPRALSSYEERRTSPEVVAEIDRLIDEHIDGEIAEILNSRGFESGCGKRFDARRVHVIRRAYGLKSRYTRLRERGWLNLREISEKLGLRPSTVRAKRAQGSLGFGSIILNDMGQHMYENPDGSGATDSTTTATCTQEV